MIKKEKKKTFDVRIKMKKGTHLGGKSLNVPMMASWVEKWFSMKITLNRRHPHNHTHCYLWIDGNHAALAAHWNIFGVVYAPTIRTVLTLIINDCLSICLTSRSAVRAIWMREIELRQLIKLAVVKSFHCKRRREPSTYPWQIVPQRVRDVLRSLV